MTRQELKVLAQKFARKFVKSRSSQTRDLMDSAKLLGLSGKTLKAWFHGSSSPQEGKLARAIEKARELGVEFAEIEPAKCSVEGCERKPFRKGQCSTHLHRLRRHGSTDTPQRPSFDYTEIMRLTALGYTIPKAIRLAGLEGQITRQAVHLHLKRVKAEAATR